MLCLSDVRCPSCKQINSLECSTTLNIPLVYCKTCQKAVTCAYCSSRSVEFSEETGYFSCLDCARKWIWKNMKQERKPASFKDKLVCPQCEAEDEIKIDNLGNIYCKKCAHIFSSKNRCPHCAYVLQPITFNESLGGYSCSNSECYFIITLEQKKDKKRFCPICTSRLVKADSKNFKYMCSNVSCNYLEKIKHTPPKKPDLLKSSCCHEQYSEIWAKCPYCSNIEKIESPIIAENFGLHLSADEWRRYVIYRKHYGRELEFIEKLKDKTEQLYHKVENVLNKFGHLGDALECGIDPTGNFYELEDDLKELLERAQKLSDARILEDEHEPITVYSNDELESYENYRLHEFRRQLEYVKNDIKNKLYSTVEIEEDNTQDKTINYHSIPKTCVVCD